VLGLSVPASSSQTSAKSPGIPWFSRKISVTMGLPNEDCIHEIDEIR
jgi:hypothetical protein